MEEQQQHTGGGVVDTDPRPAEGGRSRDRERGRGDHTSTSSSRRDKDRDRERDKSDKSRDKDGDRDREKGTDKDRERSSRRKEGSSSSSSRKRSRSRSSGRSRRSRSRDRSRDRRRSRRSPSPSPPRRKRKSEKSAWDQPPPGFDGTNAAQLAQLAMAGAGGLAGALGGLAGGPLGMFAGVGALGGLLPGAQLGLVTPQQTAQQAAQINRQARRLYVGNIPTGVSDQDLVEFFNEAMIKANVVQSDHRPVLSSQLNPDKSFSFIEFSTIDEATSGMALDGITMNGISLKVRRPKDYVSPPTAQLPPSGIHIPGIVSTNVPDSPNKIFIGGLPSYLNEGQVKELLTAFGPLKAFNLVKDSATGNSKGYAFFEYLDASVTDRACQGLNAMKLGDKTLLVQRANIGAKAQDSMMPMSPGALNASPTASSLLNLQVPAATLLSSMLLGQPQAETRVLQLLNLVQPEELVSDEDHEDILQDVRQECEKYGNVLSITIPRPALNEEGKMDTTRSVDGLGRVFVEFAEVEDATRAQNNLAGRKFGGHVVLTCYFDEEEYDRKDFSQH